MKIYFTCKRFALLAGKAARSLAKLVGLTPQRIETLLLLEHESLVLKELAIRLTVCPSVASRIANALVRLGLVAKSVHPRDRRCHQFTITDDGRDSLEPLFDGLLREGDEDVRGATAQTFGEDAFSDDLSNAGLAPPVISDRPENDLLRALYLAVRKKDYILEWLGIPETEYA